MSFELRAIATPRRNRGRSAKARITARFLKHKLAEYQALKAEIARLQAEVPQPESDPEQNLN